MLYRPQYDPAVNTPGAEDAAEQFYDEFWTDTVWSSAEPNTDERMRLTALERAIAKHDLGGGRILDVGCGRGCLTAALAHHGAIKGIDPVKAAIRRGHELFPEIDLAHQTINDLNSANAGSFDLVVSSEVIEHVPAPDQQSFVHELHGALEPGGTLLLTTPRGELHDQWRQHVDNDQPVEDWLNESALGALLRNAGFIIIEHERFGVYPISWWRVPLVISPVRALSARILPLRRAIDRAGVYQLVVARKAQG